MNVKTEFFKRSIDVGVLRFKKKFFKKINWWETRKTTSFDRDGRNLPWSTDYLLMYNLEIDHLFLKMSSKLRYNFQINLG